MKILHVVPTFLPAVRYGGVIFATEGLCQSQAERGHTVHILCTNVDGDKDSDVPLGEPVQIGRVTVIYFASHFLRRLYYSPGLGKYLDENVGTYDVLHLHSIFLWPTYKAARVARARNIPFVLTPHGMLIKDLIAHKNNIIKKIWIRMVERKTLELASAVHATTETELKEIQKFDMNLKSIRVIPLGLDLPSVEKEYSEPSARIQEAVCDRDVILFLGRITSKKGIDVVIKSMVGQEGVLLVIAGNDNENYRDSLDQIIQSLSLQNSVLFVGPVYGADKIFLYKTARLFILPSLSENFGITVLEAMGYGCPVLLSQSVGLSKVVVEHGAGEIVERDPENLKQRIRYLLQQPERLAEMGENGRALVREKFSWSSIAEKTESLYEEVRKR